jgi:hypothetical protein
MKVGAGMALNCRRLLLESRCPALGFGPALTHAASSALAPDGTAALVRLVVPRALR